MPSSTSDRAHARLTLLLAQCEAIAADDAADKADGTAFDRSQEFARHQRYESARTRELLRTLDMRRTMRSVEFGTENEEERTENGKCRMADDRGEVGGGSPKQSGDARSEPGSVCESRFRSCSC
jgi:hypothetical protein